MKSRFLFSHKYKPLGWFLFLTGMVLGIVFLIKGDDFLSMEVKVFTILKNGFLSSVGPSSHLIFNNIIDEIISLLIIVGSVLVAFSETRDEDEYISKIRMESLIWATYVNYIVLIIAIIFIYDFDFLNVMIYNMFTILLFFMLRFHYVLYKSKRIISDEE